MEWFEALLLGLIQGLTEFLPVSSSGHLEIGKVLLGVETTDDLLFTTMVHAATVLSTIVVFRKQIWDLLSGFFGGLKGLKVEKGVLVCNDQTDYLLKMVVSMIPVFVVGVFFKDQVESLFGSITVVGVALVMTALLLFFSDGVCGTDEDSSWITETVQTARAAYEAKRAKLKIREKVRVETDMEETEPTRESALPSPMDALAAALGEAAAERGGRGDDMTVSVLQVKEIA
jgi:undecaprenyl pyrophosphate phosphatase UppP